MLETACGVGSVGSPGELINLFHLDFFFGERDQRVDLECPRLARPGLSRHGLKLKLRHADAVCAQRTIMVALLVASVW